MKVLTFFLILISTTQVYANQSSSLLNLIKGVPKTQSTEVCGPDVTKWFFKDVQAHIELIKKNRPDGLFKSYSRLNQFRLQSKYLMAHKWMTFKKGTKQSDHCKDTVTLSGVCIHKRQLGNLLFGLISTIFPPEAFFINNDYQTAKITEFVKYKFSEKHPNARDYQSYINLPKIFRLVAMSIGSYLSPVFNEKHNQSDFMIFKKKLILLLNHDYSGRKYLASLEEKRKLINRNTLTFIPEFEGFNTRSCLPSQGVYSEKNISSIEQFLRIASPEQSIPDKDQDIMLRLSNILEENSETDLSYYLELNFEKYGP